MKFSPRALRAWRSAAAVASAIAALPPAIAHAADVAWNQQAGGSYLDPANWTGGVVPGTTSGALFNVGGAYSVQLPAAVKNTDLVVSDAVTLATGTNVLTLASTSGMSLTVGRSTQSASLSLDGGTIGTNLGTDLAAGAGSSASFTLQNAATLRTSNLYVGDSGRATVNVLSGSAVTVTNTTYLGTGALASGTVTVSGDHSTWSQVGVFGNSFSTAYVGYRNSTALTLGESAFNVTAGGSASFYAIDAGYGTATAGHVVVTGISAASHRSTLNAVNVLLGQQGQGTMDVSDGGLVGVTTLTFGDNGTAGPAGAGLLTIGGANGTVTAEVDAVRVRMGLVSPAPYAGTIRVNAGGVLNVTDPTGIALQVGSVGHNYGSLFIDGGTISTTSLGAAGGIFVFNSGVLTLGGGTGVASLRSDLPAGFTLSPSLAGQSVTLNVAAPGTSASNVVAAAGGMTVGGDASHGATVNLNPRSTLSVTGALTVNPGGTLNLFGGTVSADTLSLGGNFNWNAGGVFLNKSDLSVGTNGLLGASVTLPTGKSLGVSGATAIDANGSLTLAGGSLTTGTLAIAGAFTFTAGNLQFTAYDVVLGPGELFGQSLSLDASRSLGTSRALNVKEGSNLTLNGGSVNAASGTAAGTVTVNAGTLSSTQSFLVTGSLQLTGGTFSTGGFVLAAPGSSAASLSIDGGSVNAGYTGPVLESTVSNGVLSLTKAGLLTVTTLNLAGPSATYNQSGGTANFGALHFSSSNGGQVAAAVSAGSLYASNVTLDDPGSSAPAAVVFGQSGGTVSVTNVTIGGPNNAYQLTGGELDVGSFVGNLHQTGGIATLSGAGPGSLVVGGGSGAASATITSINADALTVQNHGRVTLDTVKGSGVQNFVGQLSFAGDGSLDLATTTVQTNTPVDVVRALLANGSANRWTNTAGVTSTPVAASPGSKAIAYASGANTNNASFGLTDPSIVLIQPTLIGDVNLDGKVDRFDVRIFNTRNAFNDGLTTHDWTDGDFNYDGKVDRFDIRAFNAGNNYNGNVPFAEQARTLTAASLPTAGRVTGRTTLGTVGDGKPDLVVNPATGDVTFSYDGYAPAAGDVILEIDVQSSDADLRAGSLNHAAAAYVSATSSEIDFQNLGTAIGDGVDLGAILPAGALIGGDVVARFYLNGEAVSDKYADVVAVPEPTTVAITGLIAVGYLSRRRRQRKVTSPARQP